MIAFAALILFSAQVTIFVTAEDTKIADTAHGPVAGKAQFSRDGTKYYAFYSIPFAKPPVGELRFQDPEEVEPWTEIRNETTYPPGCPQAGWDSNTTSGWQEDCLYLNVFTPQMETNANLPVMVWIYGGGYIMGDSSLYGPDYLMDKPIVLVTINYRVGALGFLAFNEKGYEGNYGMKDQSMALRWVRKNIKHFGGNSGAVTIAGSSVGGANVNWHMYSWLSKGLFHRVISQSGTARTVWSEIPRYVAHDKAITFASLAGCVYKEVPQIVKCLRQMPANVIIQVQNKMPLWHSTPLAFGIVVESEHETAFVTRSPTESNVLDPSIPWILGVTSDEGATLVSGLIDDNGTALPYLNEHALNLLPVALRFEYYKRIRTYDDVLNVTKMVLEFYFHGKPISVETFQHWKMLVADSCMVYAATESVLQYDGPKYFYIYDHVNEFSYVELDTSNPIKENLGAVHCDDLISLFKISYFPRELNAPDRKVSELMVNLWTNFVISGDPNVGPLRNRVPVRWHPAVTPDFQYLRINTSSQMRRWDWQERYAFWKRINEYLPLPLVSYTTRALGTLSGISLFLFIMVNCIIM